MNGNDTTDLTKIDCEDLMVRLRDAQERIAGLESRDRLRLERLEALELQSERLRALADATVEAVAFLDESGFCFEVNHAAPSLFGYRRDEMIGMSAFDLLAPEHRAAARERFHAGDERSYEVVALRKDGTTFPGEFRGKNLNCHGRSLRVAALRDISRIKRLETELREAFTELSGIFHNSAVGILLVGEGRRVAKANQALADIFGYESPVAMQGVSLRALHLSDADYEAFGKTYYGPDARKAHRAVEYRLRRKDGTPVWCSLSGRVLNGPDDDPEASSIGEISHQAPPNGVIWVVEDITPRKAAEARLRETLAELEVIFNNSTIGILLLDGDGAMVKANRMMAELLGYDRPESMAGMNHRAIHFSEEEFRGYSRTYDEMLATAGHARVECQLRRRDGSPVWCSLSGKALDADAPSGLEKSVLWVVDDITRRKEAEEKLRRMRTADSLTGVLNREHFIQAARREFDRRRRTGTPLALMVLAPDYFKSLAESLGHPGGDDVLRAFANICRESIRKIDICGRVGGELFAVLMPDTGLSGATVVAERLRGHVEDEPVRLGRDTVYITASIGLAAADGDADITDLLEAAEKALAEAKSDGGNRVVVADLKKMECESPS